MSTPLLEVGFSGLRRVPSLCAPGMPRVHHLGDGLREIRNNLGDRIARVLFALDGATMILLHGFIEKQQSTPKPDLDLARDRLKKLRGR